MAAGWSRTAAGRGRQLRAATGGSQGELADRPPRRHPTRARRRSPKPPRRPSAAADVQCACWPLAIEAEGIWFRWAERGAALRWRLFGLAYGDQGLLVRRSVYDAAGGYPDVGIMEDVVLIRRLGRLARVARFPEPIMADARRWTARAACGRSLRNVALLALLSRGSRARPAGPLVRPEPRDR